ncbi:MAG TPA: FHA domain-containing protein [Solirubrobacterales bacterium]|nr:FHA domain-containing protein [Solirubrobacterales bacterium]
MESSGSRSPGRAAASAASLLHAGRRIALHDQLTLGRGDDNDVVLGDERASRHHARIRRSDGSFAIEDLGSRNGTYLNGERLDGESRPLEPGDSIGIGDQKLRFLGGQETRIASRELPVIGIQKVVFEGERLSIGRDPVNDVVLADPNVSRFHAEVVRDGDAVELTDLGSRNGTRLNGELATTGALQAGTEIGIGPYRLVFDGDSFIARDDHGALRLDAAGVAMQVRDKHILEPTSLSIKPGELVAIIGESGAGKTTLLKALAGVTRPTTGRITLNGEDLFARLTDVGYVPQDDIVHRLLTVREALGYAARLRLPQDVSDEEIDAAVARVLGELSLDEHAGTLIGSLSGGQRKRTGVATELLNRPSVLFLDEPTTGLDPGLETQMMELFQALSRGGRAIAVVTHATKNLALCDRVVVMARGGVLTFDGPPSEASEFFDVSDYDGIYTALPEKQPLEWRAQFETKQQLRQTEISPKPKPPGTGRRRRARSLPQLRVLVGRYLKLFLRDRRNLLLLLGQAPILGLFGVALFESGIFDLVGGNPGDAVNMLFLMAITVIWLGAIDAAPEIVKERAVVERESAVGTRLGAYLASKLVVLIGLVAVQALLYAGVLLVFRPLDSGFSTYVTLVGLLIATGVTAVTMGLLVSSLVRTQDQATSLIPLAVIPQLLFAGAIVPLARMAEPARTLADAVFAQWSLAGIGTAVDMNARLASDPEFAQVNRFGSDFFDLAAGAAFAVQAAFAILFLAATALLLRRSLKV